MNQDDTNAQSLLVSFNFSGAGGGGTQKSTNLLQSGLCKEAHELLRILITSVSSRLKRN